MTPPAAACPAPFRPVFLLPPVITRSDSHVTTGFGNHLARPLFRERQDDNMSEEAAVELMYDALRVCYYRDKQSINKFTLAKVGAAGGHGCICGQGDREGSHWLGRLGVLCQSAWPRACELKLAVQT